MVYGPGMPPMPAPGDIAPAVSLPDQSGAVRTLAEHAGSWVLLYFYPADATPGCTAEACGLRDAWADLAAAGCTVYGVSADGVESHASFAAAERLPFPLLADPEKAVINAYGARGKKQMYGKEYEGILRCSFLIAPDGRIAKAYPKVTPQDHAAEVLADLRAMAL